MIGAVIMAHGDDAGLVLPPRVAPYQVVIVPIGNKEGALEVREAARRLADECKAAGVRVHLDDRDASPGFKFNDWELKGVPLRIELGPHDLAAGTAVVAQRIGAQGKETVSLDGLAAALPARLDQYHTLLVRRASEFRQSARAATDDWPAFAEQVGRGFADAFHCGRPECEDDIKAETTATPRCIPNEGPPESGTCIRCGQPAAYGRRIVFARAY